jgi:hypothetical protein
MRAVIISIAAVVISLGVGGAARASELSDTEVRVTIVRESVARYQATGHPCACPYNLARNGSQCGARSAYSRAGGEEPLCYPKDVTDGMVADWRRSHQTRFAPAVGLIEQGLRVGPGAEVEIWQELLEWV